MNIILARTSDGSLVPALVVQHTEDGGVIARKLIGAEPASFYATEHFPVSEAQRTPTPIEESQPAAPSPEEPSTAAPDVESQPAAQ